MLFVTVTRPVRWARASVSSPELSVARNRKPGHTSQSNKALYWLVCLGRSWRGSETKEEPQNLRPQDPETWCFFWLLRCPLVSAFPTAGTSSLSKTCFLFVKDDVGTCSSGLGRVGEVEGRTVCSLPADSHHAATAHPERLVWGPVLCQTLAHPILDPEQRRLPQCPNSSVYRLKSQGQVQGRDHHTKNVFVVS